MTAVREVRTANQNYLVRLARPTNTEAKQSHG